MPEPHDASDLVFVAGVVNSIRDAAPGNLTTPPPKDLITSVTIIKTPKVCENCPKKTGQTRICIGRNDRNLMMSICQGDQPRSGLVKISPKGDVELDQLQESVLALLSLTSRTAEITVDPDMLCGMENPNPASAGQGKDDDMPKTVELTGRKLEVFQELVKMTGGETDGKWRKIESVGPALKKALPDDFPPSMIANSLAALKKEDLIKTAGRGHIEVRCLEAIDPEAVPEDTGGGEPSGGADDDAKGGEPSGGQPEDTGGGEPEDEAPETPEPTFLELAVASLQLLFGGPLKEPFDPEELITELLEQPRDPAMLRVLYRLQKFAPALAEAIDDDDSFPEFAEDEGEVSTPMVLTTPPAS